jgi:hypothetical protein
MHALVVVALHTLSMCLYNIFISCIYSIFNVSTSHLHVLHLVPARVYRDIEAHRVQVPQLQGVLGGGAQPPPQGGVRDGLDLHGMGYEWVIT